VSGSPADRWARSGLALLTGPADGPPLFPARDIAGRLERLLREAAAAAERAGAVLSLDMRIFTERAAELGLTRGGRTSCNGTARLLRARDGWVAVNLAREDDQLAVPAWIGCDLDAEPWAALAQAAAGEAAGPLVACGQELGIPAAVVGSRSDEQWRYRWPETSASARLERLGAPGPGGAWAQRRPLVVDLSALWAGPLCASLFTAAGARVVKVESLRRPDGARFGPRGFYDRLHQGQEAVGLDFASAEGRADLARLIARADVVIEGSRPRALEQLGVDLAAVFAARPGIVWISLTAYGRTGPWRDRVGFGDDAAAAGGLVAWDEAGEPCFVGDALADPVAGVTAAAAGFAALGAGGGMLVDVALREAAAFVAEADPAPGAASGEPLLLPAARPPAEAPAAQMGADTAAVLAALA
jgi:hypothetical protein